MPHWPALILGVILTAYWGRVLRLVYKMRKRAGQSAHFTPPEPLGRALRIIWYPAVVVWVVYPYIVAFSNPEALPAWARPARMNLWIGLAASLVAVAALAGTMVCWKRMGRSWRMGINPDEKTQLVVSGPYAYVRHPIYALSSLLMCATIVALPSALMLGVGLTHLVLLQWEARREEKYLAKHHGEAYVEYCRRVGRFVPRTLKPYSPV